MSMNPRIIDNNHPWIWRPPNQAQSLEALQAAGITTVVGLKRCKTCGYSTTEVINLANRFAQIRNALVQNRDLVLEYDLIPIKRLDFAETSLVRFTEYCEPKHVGCGQKTLVPFIPEPLEGTVPGRSKKNQEIDEVIDQMNLLYFFLGGHFKFCEPELLRGILKKFGFPKKRQASADMGGEPKPIFIITLNYCLARLLDPNNADLRLNDSWPLRDGQKWFNQPT